MNSRNRRAVREQKRVDQHQADTHQSLRRCYSYNPKVLLAGEGA
jgi:hypothetical protein